ncbi:hypothetical protein [Streptomyces sp. NPDC058667]|uniref:hypothetical protein n=1 Tax=Streptomyces sp. NPDC058667 TaxID=3346588 RepID=UPI00365A54B6
MISKRHNMVSQEANRLWAEAEQEAHQIGQLAAALLGRGVPAAEVGRLLVAVDDTCKAPRDLGSSRLSESERLKEEEAAASPCGTESSDKNVRVPAQNERAGQQAQKPCDRARALGIVRDVRWPSGVTAGTVARALAADGRVITEEQAHGWLKQWAASGDVVSVGPGRYLHGSRSPYSPTLATGEHAPLLLRRAFQVVSGTPLKEMSTRDLAAALNENVNVIGGELCAMLKEVGVTRPNRGKIEARYGGRTGPRLPGYKAETLGQAIAVYNEREPREPQLADTSKSIAPPSIQVDAATSVGGTPMETGRRKTLGQTGNSSPIPDLLARAYEVVRAQDQDAISSRSLFTVLQEQGSAFRDASDMAGQLVRILAQVNVSRPNKGYVRLQHGQPRVLGFAATTLRKAITAYQKNSFLPDLLRAPDDGGLPRLHRPGGHGDVPALVSG